MFLKKTLEKLFVFFEGYLNKIVVYIKCLKKIKNHLYFFKRCFYKKKRKVLLTKNILDKKYSITFLIIMVSVSLIIIFIILNGYFDIFPQVDRMRYHIYMTGNRFSMWDFFFYKQIRRQRRPITSSRLFTFT